jgi:hypothetical protein
MRLQQGIKIDDKEYTIRELTVEEIIDLFSNKESSSGSNQTKKEENRIEMVIGQVFGGGQYLSNFLKIALPETELSELIKLAPSELMKIWEKVKEVNSYFFELAQKLNLGQLLTETVKQILTEFSKYAVVLSKEAMEEEFSNTDTPSLLEQSMSTKKKDLGGKKTLPKQ